MKYMLMFCGSAEDQREFDEMPADIKATRMEGIGQWFGQHADKLVNTDQLETPATAKTVRFNSGNPTITDGPFIEGKEVIGGYAVFDVADEAAALEIAMTWPAQGTVEVRPIVPR